MIVTTNWVIEQCTSNFRKVGMVWLVFENYFFILKNRKNKERVFDSFYFFVLKNTGNIKNIKFKK